MRIILILICLFFILPVHSQTKDSITVTRIEKDPVIRQDQGVLYDSLRSMISASERNVLDKLNKNAKWSTYIPVIATIFLAFLAAYISLRQAKANIVSSARIRWIESLRSDLSIIFNDTQLLVTQLSNMADKGVKHREADYPGFETDYYRFLDTHNKITTLSMSISLSLNDSKPDHFQLNERLGAVIKKLDIDAFHKDSDKNTDAIAADLNEATKLASLIIREQWRKAKRVHVI